MKRVHDDLETKSKQVVESFDASHPRNVELSAKKRHRACPTSPRYEVEKGSEPMPYDEQRQMQFELDLNYVEAGENNEERDDE